MQRFIEAATPYLMGALIALTVWAMAGREKLRGEATEARVKCEVLTKLLERYEANGGK